MCCRLWYSEALRSIGVWVLSEASCQLTSSILLDQLKVEHQQHGSLWVFEMMFPKNNHLQNLTMLKPFFQFFLWYIPFVTKKLCNNWFHFRWKLRSFGSCCWSFHSPGSWRRESQPKLSFCHYYWRGGQPKLYMFPFLNLTIQNRHVMMHWNFVCFHLSCQKATQLTSK